MALVLQGTIVRLNPSEPRVGLHPTAQGGRTRRTQIIFFLLSNVEWRAYHSVVGPVWGGCASRRWPRPAFPLAWIQEPGVLIDFSSQTKGGMPYADLKLTTACCW